MSIARQGISAGNVPRGASPLLIWRISFEVTIQQVWRDVKLVVAICRDLVFARSHDRYAVLTHQAAYAAMPNVQANFLQIFGHPWSTVTAQAEAGLFFDVRQGD